MCTSSMARSKDILGLYLAAGRVLAYLAQNHVVHQYRINGNSVPCL